MTNNATNPKSTDIYKLWKRF